MQSLHTFSSCQLGMPPSDSWRQLLELVGIHADDLEALCDGLDLLNSNGLLSSRLSSIRSTLVSLLLETREHAVTKA